MIPIFSVDSLEENYKKDISSYSEQDWNYISKTFKLSPELLDEFKGNVNWFWISTTSLEETTIERFADNLYWDKISIMQELREEFIIKYQNRVNWELISSAQRLSEAFIKENIKKLSVTRISRVQALSFDFVMENINIIDPFIFYYNNEKKTWNQTQLGKLNDFMQLQLQFS